MRKFSGYFEEAKESRTRTLLENNTSKDIHDIDPSELNSTNLNYYRLNAVKMCFSCEAMKTLRCFDFCGETFEDNCTQCNKKLKETEMVLDVLSNMNLEALL